MLYRDIKFGHEARASVRQGIDILAEAVRHTLGPKGRNVLYERDMMTPVITNDGVTIAKEVELENRYADLGAQLIKQVASKTNDVAGDGTTTATILAHAIIDGAGKQLGLDPVSLRKGLEKWQEKVAENLEKMSKKVSSSEEIENVATISSGSEEIGKIIAEAMKRVGNDGVITTADGSGDGLSLETTEGIEFGGGYGHNQMAHPETMTAEVNNPDILVTDQAIVSFTQLLPIIEKMANAGRKDLIILAEDVGQEPISHLVVHKLRGNFNGIVVKAPAFGDRRKAMLADIAALVGADLISQEKDLSFKDVKLENLGKAETVRATREKTVIVKGDSDKRQIAERVKSLKTQLKEADSKYDKEKIQERLANLTGGVAVIKIGAATEVELTERKHRIEDALNATRAAVEGGIVPGGGLALYAASRDFATDAPFKPGDEIITNILMEACEKPLRQIAENAGIDPDEAVDSVDVDKGLALNAETGLTSNLVKDGVIDPTNVTLAALKNAVSVATLVLTMEAAITIKPKQKDNEKTQN